MTRAQRLAQAAGFTLVELMVTMAVIATVSSVTAVNVIREIPRYRLTNAASQLAWTFRGLRMQAISQHHAVTVTFTTPHVYTIWTDRNDNGLSDGGEVHTVDIHGASPGVQLASTAHPTFNATGTVTNLPTITLTNPSGSKTLTLNILGEVTIQ
jgi:prepilin-type N-terminal cleavage/methylation domain-containing protein